MKKAFYQDNPYLDYWKKELDDNAINKKVLSNLLKENKKYQKILDLGTGSGVQIRRNLELGLLKNNGIIIGIDVNKENLQKSIFSFEIWAKENNFLLEKLEDATAIHKFVLKKGENKFIVILYEESVYNLGSKESKIKEKFPLITGLSILEHTDMKKSFKAIKKAMEKNGLLYLTINYDQHSIFGPTEKDKFKDESNLMQLFNYSGIDYQFKGNVGVGNSHCGSLLPILAKEAGLKILDYGSSDWIILPGKILSYSKNQEKVLEFFINAFYDILKNSRNEIKNKFNVSDKQIEEWYKLRKAQLKSKELYYSCIQKDILCKN